MGVWTLSKTQRVVDLGEIVILGGQPEDRHGGQSLRAQPLGQLDGMQNFVKSVGRAEEQSHLLPGDYRHRLRAGQHLERAALRIPLAQGGDQRGPLRRR